MEFLKKTLNCLKNRIYLIIPFICIAAYAIFYLIKSNFQIFELDFGIFYNSGKQVLIDPSKLYQQTGYLYLPSFACLFVLFSFFNFYTAYFLFYVLNYVFAILFVIEFNKILILKKVLDKKVRFLFLLVISNGWVIYFQFYHNQSKLIVLLIFTYIIRREITYREGAMEKDLKFYLINYNLFIFALSIVPYLIFLFLIYIFNDIKINKLIKKENLRKIGILFLSFLVQNILFLVYPSLIVEFLAQGIKFQSFSPYNNTLPQFYLREFFYVDADIITYVRIATLIILLIITILLIKNPTLFIEMKFAYFLFAFLFLDTYNSLSNLIITLSFCNLLFINFLAHNENFKQFLKNNKDIY
ncbi:MAG: hypothetical protein ACFFAO_16115, partial [Candidatus Hermodarchaeota archaeon]